MTRALAYFEKVVNVYDIAGADRVEMVQVLDFHVVAKKGEFKVGDFAVYVEVDAILPDGLSPDDATRLKQKSKELSKATGENIDILTAEVEAIKSLNTRPEFEFLRGKKFRIKALQYNNLGGIISQGILFPVTITTAEPVQGFDLTEILGVTKFVEDAEEIDTTETESTRQKGALETWLDSKFMRYEPYRRLIKGIHGKDRVGKWEDWLAKESDETNVEKLFTKLLAKYGPDDDGWVRTEKLEGQNFSAYTHNVPRLFGLAKRVDFGVCTHHRNLITDDGSQFWKTARRLDLEKRLRSIGKNYQIRGEHVGPKIQGNLYKLTEYDISLFEVFNIETQAYLEFDEFLEFCRRYEFKTVPVLDSNFKLLPSVKEMLDLSNFTSVYNPEVSVAAEGYIVTRKKGVRDHFKVKSPAYKILHGK